MRILTVLLIQLTSLAVVAGAEEASDFAVRSGVRFLTPHRAEVTWESSLAGKSSLAYGPTRQLGTVVASSSAANYHRVLIDDLQPGQTYHYRIGVEIDGKRRLSPVFELDGRMNYSPPAIEAQAGDEDGGGIEQVVSALDQPGGFAVIVGADLARHWARPLAARTTMTVVAACDELEQVEQLRHSWYAQGIYGVRLTAQLKRDVPPKLANIIICDASNLNRVADLRSPSGMLVCTEQPGASGDESSSPWDWQSHADLIWIGRPKTATPLTDWGHQYGSPANGSYVGETLGGIDDTKDLEIRWLGRPGADFGIDRNPRMPAPLAVGGRLFHQGMNRMIALDAFNGAVLWSLEIPDLRRVNIPRDSANWCADRQHVYAATKDSLWKIDAATGDMLETVALPESHRAGFDWGYVAVNDESIIGTAVKSGSAYEAYWSKGAWYDGQGSSATAKVCGSAIFAIDKKYGTLRWSRPVDAVVHSTIAVSGDRMFFVEVDDPELAKQKTGKLKNDQIWPNASVVCLDLKTGELLWKQSVPQQDRNQVIAFGIANQDQFLFESSSNNEFHFVSLDAQDGSTQWTRSTKWPSDNHGAHMQHAVLMDGRIYVQPSILDAATGEILKTDTLGKRRGCATPIGAGGSIIYRGGSGPVSLWSLAKEAPSEFVRLRPSCWLSTIPAQGMLFSPEAGGGCSCGGWMECSIGFAPIQPR
jgi:outer membrane protein assembly factor BamB